MPNKDYKGSRKVSNNGIEYRVNTNEDSAYSDVLSGNLDVMDQIPQSAVKTLPSGFQRDRLQPGRILIPVLRHSGTS